MNRYQSLLRLQQLKGAGNKAFGAPCDLLEPSQQMCFQVVMIHMSPEKNIQGDWGKLCDKYGLDKHETYHRFQNNYGPIKLPWGFISHNGNGSIDIYEPKVECIFTTTNNGVISKILHNHNTLKGNNFFQRITDEYIAKIEEEFNINFKGNYAVLSKGSAVMFKFAIHPYKPSLCPSEDLDVLKPITIIDGHVINPETDRLDLSSIKLRTPTRKPKP